MKRVKILREMLICLRDISVNIQMLTDMLWKLGGGKAINEEEKTKEK